MSKVLIAGFGDVGQQLAGELVKAGHQVWGIKRNPLPDCEAGISNKKRPTRLLNNIPKLLSAMKRAPAFKPVYRAKFFEANPTSPQGGFEGFYSPFIPRA